MKNIELKIALFIFIFFSAKFNYAQDSISVTYLANSGFMISYGEQKVIIDALFNQSYGKYEPPSDDLILKMKNGEKPFDKINLYLVTHNHGDHFYAPYVKDFLDNHPETFLVSSKEVCNQLKNENQLKNRIDDISLEIGQSSDTVINKIHLKIFRLRHLMDTTGLRVSNYAFLINLDGIKIFHPGDITFQWDKDLLDKFKIGEEKIDIVFVPYFDLSEVSKKYINEVINPKQVIAMHIPPKDFETESKYFLNAYSKGIVLEKALDTKNLKVSK